MTLLWNSLIWNSGTSPLLHPADSAQQISAVVDKAGETMLAAHRGSSKAEWVPGGPAEQPGLWPWLKQQHWPLAVNCGQWSCPGKRSQRRLPQELICVLPLDPETLFQKVGTTRMSKGWIKCYCDSIQTLSSGELHLHLELCSAFHPKAQCILKDHCSSWPLKTPLENSQVV